MNYSQEEINLLVDLIISCMKSGFIPYEEPKIGDWCLEITSFQIDYNSCIGILVQILNEKEYLIQTIRGDLVKWTNAKFVKIPSDYMRFQNKQFLH